jgi:hypothetical protein
MKMTNIQGLGVFQCDVSCVDDRSTNSTCNPKN